MGGAAHSLHIPALSQLRDRIRVRAVFDIDHDKATAAAAHFPGAQVVADFDELLESSDVDAIAILTPPGTHAALAGRAIRAGKHVLIEKPLCTSPEEAMELAELARSAGVRAAVGHNLRFHRLVLRAAAALREGVLGELLQIETHWNSPANGLANWQNDRAQGGGVLFDLGVHHIDLARFLTSSEFAELSAITESHGSDDLRARASGILAGGVRFNALWSKGSQAIHTVRLTGADATLEFSIYNALSWKITPAAPAQRLRTAAEDFLHAVQDRKAGGDSGTSYRHEWLDFAESVRTGRAPACPIEDAAKNISACEALAASAAKNMAIEVEAPAGGPLLSVVLGVHVSFDVVRRTIRYLRAQSLRHKMELVLVWVSPDEPNVPASEVDGFFSCVIERIQPGSSVAIANAAGVRSASAPIIVFAEDHCFPQPGWAEALVNAHAQGYTVVGPEVLNGNPGSTVSWCDFLIGYGPWMSPSAAGERVFLPGHNSSYKRSVLLDYGDRLDAMLEAETVLHYDLGSRGYRLYLEPRARTMHINLARIGIWLPVHFHCGRVFAGSRARQWGIGKKLFYAAASPLIPLIRLARVSRELLLPNRPWRLLPRLLPLMALGLAFDGAGQMLGYVTGGGESIHLIAAFEFDRMRYIPVADQRALEEADARAAT